MITFSCPACKHVLKVSGERRGEKLPCPKCSQRLQVPGVAQARTVLGDLMEIEKSINPVLAQKWFVVIDGHRRGPATVEQLRQLLGGGKIKPDVLVWAKGMDGWKPANTCPGLLTPAPAPAPVPAPAPTPAPAQEITTRRPSRRPRRLALAATLAVAAMLGGGAAWALLPNNQESKKEASTTAPVVLVTRPEAPPTRQEDRELTTREVVARCKPSVAQVLCNKHSSGTGFLVAGNLLVTNSHVVDFEFLDRVEVVFPSAPDGGKTKYSAELVYEDPRRDLAIFRVNAPLPALPLADKVVVEGGEKVVVIGSPGASAGETVTLRNAVNEGTLSSETTLNGLPFLQMGITINPGNSGGPVFDMRGRVIGVVVRKAVGDRQEGLGFAIPLADLKSALDKVAAEEPAKVAARHQAGAYFLKLERFTSLQLLTRQVAASGALAAERQNIPLQVGMERALDGLPQQVVAAYVNASKELKEVEERVKAILDNPNLSEAIRDGLKNLQRVLDELGGVLRNVTRAGDLKARVDALATEFVRLQDNLRKELNFREIPKG